MTDRWFQAAEDISNTLATSFSLDELDLVNLEYLAMCLRGLEPSGPERDMFDLMYKTPSTQKLNKDLRRLLKAIYTVNEISRSDDQSAKWACRIVTGGERPRPPMPLENERVSWLYGLEKIIDSMPEQDFYVSDDLDSDVAEIPDRLTYKTFVLGFRLPKIFGKLYPNIEFGKLSLDGTYWGPGVAFTQNFGDSIGFEKVNIEMIRKAQFRCAQRENLIDITY